MQISFKSDLKRLERDLGRLASQVLPVAVPQAINRALRTTRVAIRKDLSPRLGMTQRDVNNQLIERRAYRQRWVGEIDATLGKARNLIRWVSAKQAEPSAGPGQPQFFRRRSKSKRGGGRFLRLGVKARAWGRQKTYPRTFIARGGGGNVLVFKRTGEGRRSKIESVVGPSVRLEFSRDESRALMTQVARQRLPIELERAVRNRVRRLLARR